MSGIIAVLKRDGAPLPPELLQQTTEHMAFRGPDYLNTWVEDAVGLGHAAFQTTNESTAEQQPLTLDGRVWLNAYARLDDRDHLRRRLTAAGRHVPEHASDAALILHAYHLWQTECPR